MDAPPQGPSSSPPLLALPALQPPSTVLDSKMSTPGWPCSSAWLDAPPQVPSFSFSSLACPALRPPSTVLDYCTPTPGWPCQSGWMPDLRTTSLTRPV